MASKKKSADDEIRAIIEAHEAGVGEAMRVYEFAERRYFEAVTASTATPAITPATTTTPGPTLSTANTVSA